MKIFSVDDAWGVASLRQCAGFPADEEYGYFAPLGCCICKWNISTREKTMFQAHTSLITVMLRSVNQVVLTVSFSGEVKLWDSKMSCLTKFQLPTNNVLYGSWSVDGNFFSICSNGPKQMLIVYDLKSVLDTPKGTPVMCKWKYEAPQLNLEVSISNKKDKIKIYRCFNAAVFKKNDELLAVYQSVDTCRLYLFSSDGKVLKSNEISPLSTTKETMLCVGDVNDNIIAVGVQRGIFGFYDVDSLQLLKVIQSGGAAQVCMWQNELLVTVSYISGIINWWSKAGVLVNECKGGPVGSIVQMNMSTTSEDKYWIGGIMSLHYITISKDRAKIDDALNLCFLSLTGCGLAVSNNNVVAAGDFTGKLLLWKHAQNFPTQHTTIPSQIRCLTWYRDCVLIGCLNGELYVWQPSIQGNENQQSDEIALKNAYNFDGSVVTMELNYSETKLAVGTTKGNLYLFSIQSSTSGVQLYLIYRSLQHAPKKQSDGSDLPMEIWSLNWSVNEEMIATSSEDQTTVVADSASGAILKILTGHTTAVTSVRWRKLKTSKEIIATCADDRTVRIHDAVSFELIQTVNTYDIDGWHTLTYLWINNKEDTLIVATQNGYLVLWDLNSYDCLASWKLHGGSIEGLRMNKNQDFVYTTSSDCVVQRFTVKEL